MTYPIDMAWDLQTIDKSIAKLNEGYDVVLGSRNLKKSRTKRPLKRKIFSKGYNFLINLLFNLKIGDTQGTVALKSGGIAVRVSKLRSAKLHALRAQISG